MSVHREGENPSSMDGVPDLRDHNSIEKLTSMNPLNGDSRRLEILGAIGI